MSHESRIYLTNALQHTATYCNILQHTATTRCMRVRLTNSYISMSHESCIYLTNELQHTATYCNILQDTATTRRMRVRLTNPYICTSHESYTHLTNAHQTQTPHELMHAPHKRIHMHVFQGLTYVSRTHMCTCLANSYPKTRIMPTIPHVHVLQSQHTHVYVHELHVSRAHMCLTNLHASLTHMGTCLANSYPKTCMMTR